MASIEKTQGAELGNLAKLLFDKAVRFFYGAIAIEVVAGVGAVIFGIFDFSDEQKITAAVVGFGLLAIAYYFKIRFEVIYDSAETMRRQSALNEGLSWPIPKTQFSDWRCLAGEKILSEADSHPLDPDYFATKKEPGPRRFLEMTQESAFWTRHLYTELKNWIWPIFVFAAFFFLLVVTLSASGYVQQSIALKIVYAVYLILPLVLTLDILGWALRLGRIIGTIKNIEEDMERLAGDENASIENILRLVAEYNCQLVRGFPIPGWFFRARHNYISNLWHKHTSN